jgi:hypothetical protein
MPEIHPLAAIFPRIKGEAFRLLVEDIATNGLNEPIVLHTDGRVLSGWGRVNACWQANVRPIFRTYDGLDPLAFVISSNVRRRQNTPSQLAMVAARIANLKVGRPGENSANLQNSQAISLRRAAEQLGVSERGANSARAVLDRGAAELVQAVDDGEITVSAAEAISRLPPEEHAKHMREKLKKKRAGDKRCSVPAELSDLVREMLLSINVEPMLNPRALDQPWPGNVWLWFSPSHAAPVITRFIRKLLAELHAGRARQAIVLLDSRTNTPWFQEAVEKCAAICLARDIKFGRNDGETRSPVTGFALLYFGARANEFVLAFKAIGAMLIPATAYGTIMAKLTEHPLPSSVPPGGRHVH